MMPQNIQKSLREALKKRDIVELKRLGETCDIGQPVNDSPWKNETLIEESIRKGDNDSVRLLLEAGADPNHESRPPLSHAGRVGNLEAAQILTKAGAAVDNESSPLASAAQYGHAAVVKFLLDNGADPNHEQGPLAFAAEEAHLESLRLLLNTGARVDQCGGLARKLPLQAAVFGKSKCHIACVRALIEAGANPNQVACVDDSPPIIDAARHASPEILRELAAAGADVNANTAFDGSPLTQAIWESRADNVRTLLDLGADPHLSLPAENKYGFPFAGKTALEFAREQKKRASLVYLEAVCAGEPLPELPQPTVASVWKDLRRRLKDADMSRGARLNASTTSAEVEHLESHVGIDLPPEVRESYLKVNGQKEGANAIIADPEDDSCLSFCLLSLEGISSEWKVYQEVHSEAISEDQEFFPETGVQAVCWHSKWIPVAINGGGDCIFIDLAPADGGTKGQIVFLSHEQGPRDVLAPSFVNWLQQVAERIGDEV